MATAEILAIGNELLLGEVQDTNTHYLCRQLTGLGAHVLRACTVRDLRAELAGELRAAIARQPALIVTTGGLGPTDDDLTLAAVADAAGVSSELHPEALLQVTAKYAQLASQGELASADLNEARKKMALLPQGAIPLSNPVGAAPGVQLPVGGTILVCLPGVPKELKAIFESSLAPLLHDLFGGSVYVEEVLHVACNDESALSPILRSLSAEHPGIYVKSRARSFDREDTMKVMVSARGDDGNQLRAELARVVEKLGNRVGIVPER